MFTNERNGEEGSKSAISQSDSNLFSKQQLNKDEGRGKWKDILTGTIVEMDRKRGKKRQNSDERRLRREVRRHTCWEKLKENTHTH